MSFFVLVFGLSVPFWVVGAMTDLELRPGLPLASLMAICPAVAAAIQIERKQGRAGVLRWLRRLFSHRASGAGLWYIPTLGLMPLVMLASYGIMRVMGVSGLVIGVVAAGMTTLFRSRWPGRDPLLQGD